MKFNAGYYFLILTGLFTGIGKSRAQSPGFMQQDVIKQAGITTDAQIEGLGTAGKQTTRVYYDGLGRTIQTVAEQASPLQNDLVQPVVYDDLGRQTTGYLPYAGQSTDASGSYRSNAVSTAQPAFYNNTAQYTVATDAAPYSQQVFENSPLQRLLAAGMTGSTFQPVTGQHYKTINYRPNNSSDGNILAWNPDGSYTAGSYYAAGTLSVTDGTDEDHVETIIYTDIAGHTVLKRQKLSGTNLDTYYIYNSAGLPAFIVPPNAMAVMGSNYNILAAPVNTLIFRLVYNTHGQLIQKTVPGKGIMSVVYDPLNRPVLLQDANMALHNQWNYIKYDAKGRAVSQGIYTDNNNTSYSAMQSYVNGLAGSYATAWSERRSAAVTNNGYYTNAIFPTGTAAGTSISPLAYAYYDDYDLNQDGTADFHYQGQGLNNEETATAAQVKGMPTMVTETTIGAGLTGTWLTKVTFYDHRLNPIQVISNNHVYYTGYATQAALTDSKTSVPDFTGVPQVTQVVKQTAAGTVTTVQTIFTYDQAYRLNTVSQVYNNGTASVVASYSYNEIGQVIQKNLGQVASGPIPANVTLSSQITNNSTVVASNSIVLSPATATTPGFSTAPGIAFTAEIASNNYLQTVDYRYNIRGQLLYINNSKLTNDGGVTNSDNNDLFGMSMQYDQSDGKLSNGGGNNQRWDGKLTAVKWMSKDGSGNSTVERSYCYNYDQLNRYVSAAYAERPQASTGNFSNNLDGFDESNISYDAGGNLLTLNRFTSTPGALISPNQKIDSLTYRYDPNNPNQLHTVVDGTSANCTGFGFRNLTGSAGNYFYDPNGNLVTDPYKGLTLTYDVLNRTDKITITTATNRYINYTYDGSGNLIRKQAYDNNALQTTTDYVDGFVYLNGTLSYFPMPEGRVLNNGGTFKQEFIITDQQGNARVSFQDNGSGTAVVKQENSYYGFGLIMPNSPVAMPATPNKQLYNGGSEWQNDYSNLPDYYQTFNRNYDAALGRFIGVDPDAEGAESLSTYQYAGNNPVMNNDPLGNKICGNCGIVGATSSSVGGFDAAGFFSDVDFSLTADSYSFQEFGSNYVGQTYSYDENGKIDQIFENDKSYDTYQQYGKTGVDDYNNGLDGEDYQAYENELMGYAPISQSLAQSLDAANSTSNGGINQQQANQGGSSWISDALDWMGNHFYTEVSGRLTQGAIGFTSGRFAGSEIDLGKHNLATLTTGTDKGGINAYKDDGTKIYGGQLVVPVEGIPIGIGATHDANSGQNSGIFGIGAFGYERTGNSNFIGLDMTSGVNLYFLGVEGTAKIGFKW